MIPSIYIKLDMKRLLLLTAIFLSGCVDIDIEMDADSPAVTPTETISLYVDNFNVSSDCGCAVMPGNPNRNAFCMAFFKRSNARVDD